ncbi:MAG: hypothetical protein Q8K78_10675, partial [Planctomycetaceae bacterium]|nr:hypothetical protein [Planctomycetaceae bacterium]
LKIYSSSKVVTPVNNLQSHLKWCPTYSTLVGGVLVVAGLLLTSVSWWCLLLTAVGGFGPGILREQGWLHDKDEFQLYASYRSGYHAYLVSGFVAVLLVAYFRSSGQTIDDPQELATLFLVLQFFTALLSSLIGYWGTQKAATRILALFGCAWLVFAILSNLGREWTGWTALLLSPLLAAPFFVLAWLAPHRPRLTGVLLMAVSIFFVQFFGFFRHQHLAVVNQAITFVLFVGPLLASGIALIGTRGDIAREEDDPAGGPG